MTDGITGALAATRQLRQSPGYRALAPEARQALERDLRRVEAALGHDPYALGAAAGRPRWGGGAASQATATATPTFDPYALGLDISDLQARLRGSAGSGGGGDGQASAQPSGSPPQQAPAQPPAAPPPAQSDQFGTRVGEAIQAVDFPGFVASLVSGTFRAIVDATAQQVKQYAELVASLSTTLEQFTAENVSPNQARDHLVQRYPQDLLLQLPAPGAAGTPKVVPRPERANSSPAWLSQFDLGGEELTEELTEGPLLDAAQRHAGEERMHTLATMVLMGINRVVVSEGDIRARLQFHATALDTQKATGQQQGMAIAASGAGQAGMTQMMVSTLQANAQAESSMKADLLGEVRIAFRSETFPLERFADSAAIQLLNRHARWKTEEPAPAAAPAAAQPGPAPAPAPAATHGGTA